MGIYPHAALQYHRRPKAKRGIAMLSVDKFPYPRKQTRGNDFIPCSNNICDILSFRSFKIPAITLIWPKSPYKHSVLGRTVAVRKADCAVRIAIVTSSMTFLCLYISRWWRQTWDTAPYFTVVNHAIRSENQHGARDKCIYTHTGVCSSFNFVVSFVMFIFFVWVCLLFFCSSFLLLYEQKNE